jgi:hypothetical protein
MTEHPTLAERVARHRELHHWSNPHRNEAPSLIGGISDESLATCLGWFSIGLGVAEVFAPRALGRLIGAGSFSRLLPLFGVREIASGIGILSNDRPAGWLWSRVAGDAMDLAFLAAAHTAPGADSERLRVAALAVAGVTALDVLNSARLSASS